MLTELVRPTRSARVWLDEVPESARVEPAGTVETYWQRPGPPAPGPRRAAWEFSVARGGHTERGLLGAELTPHEYPYLRVRADVGGGLPHEYAGAVLAGAVQEPWLVGSGTLHFRWAADDVYGSSWRVFRLLAVGVLRLLATPPGAGLPPDLLPHFGGNEPADPGSPA